MKIEVVKISSDLELKKIGELEINSLFKPDKIEVELKLKEFLKTKKINGLWIDSKPLGFLKTRSTNYGVKIT